MLTLLFAIGKYVINYNYLAIIVYTSCGRLKDSSGWQQVFTSPHIDNCIERIAINAKMNSQSGNSDGSSVMVAISYGNQVRLWGVSEQGSRINIGNKFFYF